MLSLSKSEGARYAHTEKTTNDRNHNTALNGLQVLRDIACCHAIKYRWDPALSRAHEEYLNLLNGILKECEM